MNLTDSVPGGKSDVKSNLSDTTLLVITPDYPDKNNNYIGSIFVKNQSGFPEGIFQENYCHCAGAFTAGAYSQTIAIVKIITPIISIFIIRDVSSSPAVWRSPL